jgi:prepilin-type N-terminal cleavage/methylation domain-containing protein
MINFPPPSAKKTGFTVVELVIVIVVIGILATIVLVLYPGYQARTRDNARKSDVQQVAAALSAYAVQNNNYIESGGGCGSNAAAGGSGNGWLIASASDTPGYSAKSILQCMIDANLIGTGNSFRDPSGCDLGSGGCLAAGGAAVRAYMKATCSKGGVKVTYIFTYLETQPSNNSVVDNLCDTGTISGFSGVYEHWGTRYGMNYYVPVR